MKGFLCSHPEAKLRYVKKRLLSRDCSHMQTLLSTCRSLGNLTGKFLSFLFFFFWEGYPVLGYVTAVLHFPHMSFDFDLSITFDKKDTHAL